MEWLEEIHPGEILQEEFLRPWGSLCADWPEIWMCPQSHQRVDPWTPPHHPRHCASTGTFLPTGSPLLAATADGV